MKKGFAVSAVEHGIKRTHAHPLTLAVVAATVNAGASELIEEKTLAFSSEVLFRQEKWSTYILLSKLFNLDKKMGFLKRLRKRLAKLKRLSKTKRIVAPDCTDCVALKEDINGKVNAYRY